MNKAFKGYTIIEVLLVLAISTLLLFSAILVFRGQQNETEYTQTVQELNSVIVNYANKVNAGISLESGDVDCFSGANSPPTFNKTGTGGYGNRNGCIYLGQALQIDNAGSSTLNSYTVIGNQYTASGDIVSDFSNAYPTVATDVVSGNLAYILNTSFTLAGGANFKSVGAKSGGAVLNGNWYMTGLYTDLNGSPALPAGNLKLDMVGYNLSPNPNITQLKSCAEGTTCTPQSIGEWDLCVQNSNASHTMLLALTSNNSGVSTHIVDGGC
jgi:type II secretory pathway pseudopilin PulG